MVLGVTYPMDHIRCCLLCGRAHFLSGPIIVFHPLSGRLRRAHFSSRVGVRYENECKAYGVIRTLPIGRVAMVNNSLYEMVAALRKAIQSMGIELNMNMCFFGESYLGWEFYLFVTEMNI